MLTETDIHDAVLVLKLQRNREQAKVHADRMDSITYKIANAILSGYKGLIIEFTYSELFGLRCGIQFFDGFSPQELANFISENYPYSVEVIDTTPKKKWWQFSNPDPSYEVVVKLN